MKAKLTNRPVEQVIAAIHALDLQPIKLRVMDPELGEGWTREYTESIEHAYRNYLTMLVKHPEDAEDIVVSKDVDEFWHTHILHTMKYTEDCERVFGTYLHHNPHIGERTQADIERKAVLAEKTRGLYQQDLRAARPADAAWCGAAVTRQNATWCGAAIKAQNAAWCGAAVESAWCGAAVGSKNAAWCGAAVKSESAAWCGAAVKAQNAAWCGAAAAPAWCGAAVRSKNAAWCGAAVEPESAAWCGAAQPASREAKSSMQPAASPAI